MATSTEISFSIVDVTAKEDSTPTATDKQPFINLNDLKLEDPQPHKVATGEHDFWLMDGSFELFPDDPENYEWGFWSLSMSDASGAFAVPPGLTCNFAANHTSLGVTLYFDELNGDYSNSVNIKWYDSSNTLMSDMDFTPDGPVYFCDNQVLNYRKIVITFLTTFRPYRYAKLANVVYGAVKVFKGDELISANVLEEIDLLSSQISINTLDFRVHSTDAKFNIINPSGVYSTMQQRQPLAVTEKVNGEVKQIGTYYLEDWENDTENTIRMSAIDEIGVMDKTTFRGGIYVDALVPDVIDDIMTSANAQYELDSSYATTTIRGWIPICSHREATQHVAFAIGAIVDCSRSDKVKIYPPSTVVSSDIPYGRKIQGQKLSLKPLVTGVEVKAHNYTQNTTAVELFNGSLTVGSHEIVFSEPAHTLSVTGATISQSGANYAMLTVTASGIVVLSGKKYTDSTKVFGVYTASLPANEKTNVLKVDEATMVSSTIAQTVAQRIYDYNQKRYSNEVPIILADEAVGNVVTVDSMYNQKLKGTIEKLDISLTGGYVGKAVIVGVVDGA